VCSDVQMERNRIRILITDGDTPQTVDPGIVPLPLTMTKKSSNPIIIHREELRGRRAFGRVAIVRRTSLDKRRIIARASRANILRMSREQIKSTGTPGARRSRSEPAPLFSDNDSSLVPENKKHQRLTFVEDRKLLMHNYTLNDPRYQSSICRGGRSMTIGSCDEPTSRLNDRILERPPNRASIQVIGTLEAGSMNRLETGNRAITDRVGLGTEEQTSSH
jgi:hypothetical protein